MPKAKPESLTARFEKLKADVEALAKKLANQPVAPPPPPENPEVNELKRRVKNLEFNDSTVLMPESDHHIAIWGALAVLTVAMLMLMTWQTTMYMSGKANPNPTATVSTPPAAPVVEPAISPTLGTWTNDGNLVRTGGLMLQLTVNRECWMDGESDGTKIPGHVFQEGDTRNIGALHEISIRSGCPGGLDYKVNGKETSPVNLSNNPKIEVVKFESEIASR